MFVTPNATVYSLLDNGMQMVNNNIYNIAGEVIFEGPNYSDMSIYEDRIAYRDSSANKVVLAEFNPETGEVGDVIKEYTDTNAVPTLYNHDRLWLNYASGNDLVCNFDGDTLCTLPVDASLISQKGTDGRFVQYEEVNEHLKNATMYNDEGTPLGEPYEFKTNGYISALCNNVYTVSQDAYNFYLVDKNANIISDVSKSDTVDDMIYENFYRLMPITRYIPIASDPIAEADQSRSEFEYTIKIYDTVNCEFIGNEYDSYFASEYSITNDPETVYEKEAGSTIFNTINYMNPNKICAGTDVYYIKEADRWYSFNLVTGEKKAVSFTSAKETKEGFDILYTDEAGNTEKSGSVVIPKAEEEGTGTNTLMGYAGAYNRYYCGNNQVTVINYDYGDTSLTVYDAAGKVILDSDDYEEVNVLKYGYYLLKDKNSNLSIVKTTSDAYVTADYDKVDEAIEKVPSDLSVYTDATASALTSAVNAVVRDKSIKNQSEVDAYETAILTAVSALKYKIKAGNDQTIELTDKKEATFESVAPFSEFKEVLVDGKQVDPDNYTVREGSTIVTLKPEYLATLPVGNHEITIVSEHGKTDFSIAVTKTEPGKTEPGNTDVNAGENITYAVILLLLACAGAASIVGYTRYKKKSSN